MSMEVEFHDARAFEKWLQSLDQQLAGRIVEKLRYVAEIGQSVGLPLVRRLGPGLHELRVDKYRVYITTRQGSLLVLAAGSKDSQARDIARARRRQP
jgi:putative addiction module killer protein